MNIIKPMESIIKKKEKEVFQTPNKVAIFDDTPI
jgi:hypothetical protein